jgi:iron(III) transport system ATP-binding protein
MSGLELRGISHRYGSTQAVDGVSLAVARGEVVGLLGPSGCGKTTVLRVAAGLEPLQQGEVWIDGRVMARPGASTPPEERSVGLVFQDYALFPHLTVFDNVAFGLRRCSRQDRQARALDVLRRVGLADLAAAYPHMLSGGQQQRVALARALAPDPSVMLLDEPFAGLDRRLREQVRSDVLRLLKETDAAVLLVTHDPEEAMALSDRIAVMRAGTIEQDATPSALYGQPATAFTARFLGETTVFDGIVRGGSVETPLGTFPASGLAEGAAAEVHVRPEYVQIDAATAGPSVAVRGTLREVRLLGALTALSADVPDRIGGTATIHALRMGRVALVPGTGVSISLDPALALVFPISHSSSPTV